MSKGPCLCGDPYCGSCGNPEQAAYEDACTELGDRLIEMKLSKEELELFEKVGRAAVERLRPMLQEAYKDGKEESTEYIHYLEDKLKGETK